MKKTISMMIMVAIIALGLSCSFNAAEASDIMPLWTNISTMSANITFSDINDGSASGTVIAPNPEEISGTLTLYEQNSLGGWSIIDSVSDSTSFARLSLKIEFEGVTNGYYKAVFTVTVTKNGVTETETKTSYETCE